MSTRARYAVAPILLALLLAACDDALSVVPPPQLRVTPVATSIPVGERVALGANVVGARPTGATLQWRVAPESVATVERVEGDLAVVHARRAGAATLTATLADAGHVLATSTAQLAVIERACAGIVAPLRVAPLSVAVGRESRASLLVHPCVPAERGFDYRVTDTTVARVDSTGLVRGITPGATAIVAIARADSTIRGAAHLAVGWHVYTTSVVVNPPIARLAPGDTLRLLARVVGAPGNDARTTFRSDDPSIATVDADGLLRGVRAGELLVRVTAVADTAVWVGVPVTVTPP